MKHPPTADSARISEIFSSLQGEGTRLGERHLFIRFEECNIHCQYCDELDKQGTEMSLEAVMETVLKLEKESGPHSFVSLTGGEPLIYLAFLKPLIKKLKSRGFKIYLETSGILPRALEEVVEDCDVIAMDLKPASVTGERGFLEEHRQFLKIAQSRETFAKMVLSKQIDSVEFDELIELVRETAPATPVVLQPLSAEIEGHEDPELMKLLAGLQNRAGRVLENVRIVPRLHKILKIR
ncbi:MAG TPA: 7-carboxy-7-deazaguanine synthase QueE [bacterium]|nr:7-carboxy-7-deazaguanine synthase QueE [bacterium]